MGSTRLKHKNLRELVPGLTLIDQAVATAKNFDICISTDEPELINLSDDISIVKRPKNISDSKSQITPSIKHALIEIENSLNKKYDFVIVLMPSIAARSNGILKKMIKILEERKNISSVMTAAICPPWIWKISDNKDAQTTWFPNQPKISQDLPTYLAEHASIIINKRSVVMDNKKWTFPLCLYELPSWSVGLDIDDEMDLNHAKLIFPSIQKVLEDWRGDFHIIEKISSIKND